jgi:predicted nucleotidyltransferase
MVTQIALPHAEIVDFCQRHHIRKLSLFGSVLRDDFAADSDIDVLVEFEDEHIPNFLRFVEMQDELHELLGRDVDLHTPQSLSKYFRQKVLNQAQVIYERAG